MSPFFNKNEVRNIVWKQIEKDESPGEQVGGARARASPSLEI